jgi:hypothetical protein
MVRGNTPVASNYVYVCEKEKSIRGYVLCLSQCSFQQ